jgi:DNA polymerase-3 subunit epsilon
MEPLWITQPREGRSLAAALDTETTGLSAQRDAIIEIAVQLFEFDHGTGEITARVESYCGLQDPGFPISPEIQRITGITPADVLGQAIDWRRVDELLGRADFLIAHNCAFDRKFVDAKSSVSGQKIWGCSSFGIDWRAKGFANSKLPDLCATLGIEFQAHRAMADVQAMLQLLTRVDSRSNRTHLHELLEGARREVVWMAISGQTYNYKELIKQRGFRWSGEQKWWEKVVPAADLSGETAWVESTMPGVQTVTKPMDRRDRYR